MKTDARTERWEIVTVCDIPMLFSCLRIDRNTIPEGLYLYEVRHADDDWGEPVEIAKGVLVNHFGTLLSKVNRRNGWAGGVCVVDSYGVPDCYYRTWVSIGVRPFCYLDSSILVFVNE